MPPRVRQLLGPLYQLLGVQTLGLEPGGPAAARGQATVARHTFPAGKVTVFCCLGAWAAQQERCSQLRAACSFPGSSYQPASNPARSAPEQSRKPPPGEKTAQPQVYYEAGLPFPRRDCLPPAAHSAQAGRLSPRVCSGLPEPLWPADERLGTTCAAHVSLGEPPGRCEAAGRPGHRVRGPQTLP